MNVVIGVRELCMAHVRAQIGNHNVQIFALVHPVVQPVGCKSMTKVIKTRGTSAGSRNTCFLQNQAESLLQPSLSVKTALSVGKEGLTTRHNSGDNSITIREHFHHIICHHDYTASVLLALHNIQPPFVQIYVSNAQPSDLCRTQAAAIHQLHHGRNHKMSYRKAPTRF